MSSNLAFENSFASHEMAKYLSIKNKVKPENISLYSNKKFIFNCKNCNHEFEKFIRSITQQNSFCSYCTGRAICGNENCQKCYVLSFASHEKSKYWSKQNVLKPHEVFKKSNKKYLFDCNKCNHTFEIGLDNLSSGNWCIYCACQKICGKENCEKCRKISFYDNPKSKFWSNKNNLKPIEVFNSSGNKYFFDCNICNHTFNIALNNVNAGKWCSYCSNHTFCNNLDKITCEYCFNKSFASNKKSDFLSQLNKIHPTTITNKSEKKLLFNCNVCKHEFETTPAIINMGCWCPYCVNNKLCGKTNCKICFEKSLASYEKIEEFSVKNKTLPINIFFGNNSLKFVFNCPDCKNEYLMSPYSAKKGAGCTICKNKTEKKLFNFINSKYENIIFQFKSNWCTSQKTSFQLPFDFLIKDLNIIIELDGRQHFMQVAKWNTPDETQQNDFYKMTCANLNGYSVIRIYQEDVFYDKFDWKKSLTECVEEIAKLKISTIKYLCSSEQYNDYINNFLLYNNSS